LAEVDKISGLEVKILSNFPFPSKIRGYFSVGIGGVGVSGQVCSHHHFSQHN
jgi:hypothetical protein